MVVQQQLRPWLGAARVRSVAVHSDPPAPSESGVYFADRRDAGRLLGTMLAGLSCQSPVVVGIARGGMPVAAEIARSLGAPLRALAPGTARGDHAGRRRLDVRGAVVVLVDDQLASTASVRGAVGALRRCGATRVILAVPVAASEAAREARRWVDDL
ncbi:MAG: phosphoribosyltransferase family protein, partial [Solirubrobacteraceae bacterium]